MNQRERNAEIWAANEEALRARHGELSLMVRHQIYAKPDGQTMAIGGWAFLDGEPAIVPMDLDLLVVSVFGEGEPETMGREPAQVVAALGECVTQESEPVAHWAIRVPEDRKAGFLDQIRALPEHTPGAAASPAPRAEVPVARPAQVSSQGAGAGLGLAAAALIGGGCLVLLVLMAGGGAAYFAYQSAAPDPYVDRYEPYEPYEPPLPPPAAPVPRPTSPRTGDVVSIPLPASVPSRGASTAPLTIQVFSDFQCPFCARVNPTLERVEETYQGRVRIVWRHFPLAFHRNAMPAAEASMEVFEQGGDVAFWAYHDLLFENQRALADANLIALAGRVPGVNAQGVAAALSDHRHQARVQSDMDDVSAAGQRFGTPTFLIGDQLLSGAQPFERFSAIIDGQLAGR